MRIDFSHGEALLEAELRKELAKHYTPLPITLPPNNMTLPHHKVCESTISSLNPDFTGIYSVTKCDDLSTQRKTPTDQASEGPMGVNGFIYFAPCCRS